MTLKLPEELALRLEKRARRLSVAKSALVRQWIERAMSEDAAPEEAASVYELTAEDCGCVDSGCSDLAVNRKHMDDFGK